MFTPVAKSKLISKMVESQIEETILSKSLLPGDRIPSELELCKQFNVSRTAIREALRMLTARGLISIIKGKGIFVQIISAETVMDPFRLYLQMQSERDYVIDVIKARQMIEPSIAASAALLHTEEDAEKLRKDYQEFVACHKDSKGLSQLDMLFHLDIARASENYLIPLILEPIQRLVPQIKSSVYETVKDAKEYALEWHGKILDKILKRDADGARAAMTRHLEIAEQQDRWMIEHLKKEGTIKKAVLK